MDFSNDIMAQIGQDVIYRRAHDAVVLNIEQMGCEWEELREPYRGKDVGFVEYLQKEEIEWVEWVRGDLGVWGFIRHDIGWDTWDTEKGRGQREAYFDFWDELTPARYGYDCLA
tara:strand:- start:79 stop:420 length:342 start_codon:yes stop_codon:yes gene_type:complete